MNIDDYNLGLATALHIIAERYVAIRGRHKETDEICYELRCLEQIIRSKRKYKNERDMK